MSNQLAQELSPYLLQHADNPVDWLPWGDEAFRRARAEDKLIFLSIGYSACHWCHVMAHESFEDPQIAAQLNADFVPVKVDREERPDIDQIYMEAVQSITGQGGWPLSVFLTPAGEPFFGGTYWPPRAARGMPGFGRVLHAVSEAWRMQRADSLQRARQVTDALRDREIRPEPNEADSPLDERLLVGATNLLSQVYDADHGGFGRGGPKFPQAPTLLFLLRRRHRTNNPNVLVMAVKTLEAIAAGGIRDHLGGGFHRYAVDARWLVPHFEKMLYDNAMLAECYVEAWQATGNDAHADAARAALDYILRDMSDPEGGFYAAEDADSEGEEGKFYLWTRDEVDSVLGNPAQAAAFCRGYDVTEAGNFEGRNILNLAQPLELTAQMLGRPLDTLKLELADARQKLFEARKARVRPACDDKILTSWNALAISALARAGKLLGEPRYLAAAGKAADFLIARLRDPAGRLMHCYRAGQVRATAMLDDHAALALALLALYEAEGDRRRLDAAVTIADNILARFADTLQGGFFYTAVDHEPLLVRKKDAIDSAVPSGNGLAALLLVRLAWVCQRDDYRAAAERTLKLYRPLMREVPLGSGVLLTALNEWFTESAAPRP